MKDARREDGAALVEFALVLPVVLLLVFGMMQFGLMLNAKIDETHLTREGARYAAVNQNPGAGSLPDYILSLADTQDLEDNAVVCVEYLTGASGTQGEVGDPVKFTMSYAYNLLPFFGDFWGLAVNVPIITDATMRLEAVPDEIPAGCSS